jgi:NADP-dependent 3-hydroxy acid dehydrogenase YdfG
MKRYWEGKSAVVTGAASGIGFALARALIARGVQVRVADIDADGIRQAARVLGSNAHPVVVDVRDASAVRDVIESAAREFGSIDFLFNNKPGSSCLASSMNLIQNMLTVSLTSTFAVS